MPAGGFVDYYELLGIDKLADAKQVRVAYLKHAKDHHPDAGGSTERMQLLNLAYETLAHQTSRAAYDKLHALHTTPHEDLDLREDFVVASGQDPTNDRFVDDFVDDIYNEYYGEASKPKKQSRFKKALFAMFGVS